MEKKPWQKPELIPLTRCKPQEAVLSTCKYYNTSGDPTVACTNCVKTTTFACDTQCSGYHAS